MKDGKIVLIAHHLLESSICAYIEWIVNVLMMTANKIDYKDTCLVMLSADAITHKSDRFAYLWSLLFSSCRVSLAEYNRVLIFLFPLLQVIEGNRELILVCGNLLVGSEMIPFPLRP